jgi:heme iron utilization protein
MSNSVDQGLVARQLLKEQSAGVLSTHSADVEGYPFGSVTSYILNYEGEPTIFISNLAQHTRNLRQNNKVSLTVFDLGAEDPQAAGRLTWIGDAEPMTQDDASLRRRYERYIPSAAQYMGLGDFSLYRIRLRRARFIGGFGQIHWVDPGAMLLGNPFRDSEESIVEHMNQDHKNSLFHYCRVLKSIEPGDVSMAGIDSEGFDLLADRRKLRINFDSPIATPEEARAVLVKLARL